MQAMMPAAETELRTGPPPDEQIAVLRQQLAQMQKLAALGELVSTTTHEFNNVLMGIQPYVDILARTNHDRKSERALAQIGQSIKRGKRISEEILSFTRAVEPNRRAIPVREWLLDLDIEIRALAGANVRVVIDADDDLVLDGDAGQLSQVLTNLVTEMLDPIGVGDPDAQDRGRVGCHQLT